MSSRSSDSFQLVDALRGIAAAGVVAFHAGLSIERNHPAFTSHPPPALDALRLGALGVEVFFVLSGYCIATAISKTIDSGKPASAYAIARLRRIFPPYWATLAITLAAVAAMRAVVRAGWIRHSSLAEQAARLEPSTLAANVLLVQVPLRLPSIVAVSWTLCYEWAFYALLGLFVFPLARAPRSRRFLAAHVATVCCAFWAWVPGHPPVWPLDLWPAFGVGVAVFDFLARRPNPVAVGGLVACIAPIAALAWLPRPVGIEPRSPTPFVLATLVTAGLLLAARSFDGRVARWPGLAPLRGIGTFSYSLYLMHFLCIGLVGQLFGRVGLPDGAWGLELAAMGAAALGVAWTFHRLVERRFLSSSARTPARPGAAR